ncbi:inositol monophosphatase family protein [Escherichia coli]
MQTSVVPVLRAGSGLQVAAGRVDGFFEIGLRPWIVQAKLLVREAGGIVSDFTGGHNYMLTGNIVAGNPRVVKAMLANMRDELSDALKR